MILVKLHLYFPQFLTQLARLNEIVKIFNTSPKSRKSHPGKKWYVCWWLCSSCKVVSLRFSKCPAPIECWRQSHCPLDISPCLHTHSCLSFLVCKVGRLTVPKPQSYSEDGMTQMKCLEPHPAWNKMAIVRQDAKKYCGSKNSPIPSSQPLTIKCHFSGTQFAKPAVGLLPRTWSSVLPSTEMGEERSVSCIGYQSQTSLGMALPL